MADETPTARALREARAALRAAVIAECCCDDDSGAEELDHAIRYAHVYEPAVVEAARADERAQIAAMANEMLSRDPRAEETTVESTLRAARVALRNHATDLSPEEESALIDDHDVAVRADERAKLVQMLRAHVSGHSTEHDAGVRYAASLIERKSL